MQDSLPFQRVGHDSIRQGLPALKESALPLHPVDQVQKNHAAHSNKTRFQTLKNIYGTAVPAREEIEKQILSKFGRLPGLPSSMLGLESLTGELDEFTVNSFIGASQDIEVPLPDMHTQMEAKLGLSSEKMLRGLL